MSKGTRAWDHLSVIIYSTKPQDSMKMENRIEELINSYEVYSFEKYDELYDFCNNSLNGTTILFIDVVDEEFDYHNVYTQIDKLISKKGILSFLVPVYSEHTKFKTSLLHSRLQEKSIELIAKDDLWGSQGGLELEKVWAGFVAKYKNTVLSKDNFNTYRQLLSGDKEKLVFLERVVNLLASNANLSWEDQIILDFLPTLSLINGKFPELVSSDGVVEKVNSVLKTPNVFTFNELYNNLDLKSSIFQASKLLLHYHQRNELDSAVSGYQLPKGRRKIYVEKMLNSHKSELIAISKSETFRSDTSKKVA